MVVLRDAPRETSDQIRVLHFLELVVGRMLQQSGSRYWVVKWLWGVKGGRMERKRIADLFSGCGCHRGALVSPPLCVARDFQILPRPQYESFGYSRALTYINHH